MLKLIALIIPEPLKTLVIEEQELIRDRWGPKHALRTPPHLTIIPPIEVSDEEITRLWTLAKEIANQTGPFEIEFNGYGAFKPRVVFINLQASSPLEHLYRNWRTSLERNMGHVLEKYPDRPYHPHLTLAHRDVDRVIFSEMWSYFKEKEIKANVTFDRFCILKHHAAGWSIEEEFKFE